MAAEMPMEAEVSYGTPEGLPDAGLLMTTCQRLLAIPDAKEREDVFLTLFKLIDGVLAAPDDVKRRRVKKTNDTFHRKLGRFAAGLDFLRAAGFVDSNDPDARGDAAKNAFLSLRVAHLLRLTDAHHTLARAAQQVGISAPPMPGSSGFNPYVSNRQAADPANTIKAGASWTGDAQRTREEVLRRKREMTETVADAPPIDLQPSAFWLSAGKRLEEVIRATAPVDEERAADSALLQLQLASVKAAVNGGNAKFESADKKQLAELSHRRVHAFCILRVICPDKSVLQAHFRSGDRGEHVVALLAPLLAPSVRELGWYIYQSPPMHKLAPEQTLAAAGLTPGANMYLGFEGGARPPPPYLEQSLVSQLGPPPEEAAAAAAAAVAPAVAVAAVAAEGATPQH